MSERFIKMASKVSEVLMRLSQAHMGRCSDGMPWADFAYGEALVRWEDNGKDPWDFFSTDDPIFLEFSIELQEEFGLEIVDPQEATRRKRLADIRTKIVDGFDITNKKFLIN